MESVFKMIFGYLHMKQTTLGTVWYGSCHRNRESSFLSCEHDLRELDEGISFRGWAKFTDLPDGFMAVALGEVGCLLHTITLYAGNKAKHMSETVILTSLSQ